MTRRGVVDRVAALVVGRRVNVEERWRPSDERLEDVVARCCDARDIPVLLDVDPAIPPRSRPSPSVRRPPRVARGGLLESAVRARPREAGREQAGHVRGSVWSGIVASMAQVVQIVAGALVVGAFAGLQLEVLSPYRFTYLALNFAGTAVLTLFAVTGAQYGFVLTNGVWAVLSFVGLLRLGRTQQPTA